MVNGWLEDKEQQSGIPVAWAYHFDVK